MKVRLSISKGREQYTYDPKTDTMTGKGPWLEMMNMFIGIATYGDNPYREIADIFRGLEYDVKFQFEPDESQLDAIV
jgi:hypothetical protein